MIGGVQELPSGSGRLAKIEGERPRVEDPVRAPPATRSDHLRDPAVDTIVADGCGASPRQRAEAEIQQNQAALRMAVRLGHMGAWSINLPTSSLIWSDETRAIHEVESTPTFEQALDFYPREFRPRLQHAFNECVANGIPFDIEAQIITTKGRRLWVRTIGEAVRDAGGAISGLQGAIQDISERKEATELNRVVAERLTTALESITEAFFTVDHDWRFTYVNRHAEQLLRRTRAGLLGKRIWDELPDIIGPAFQREYLRAIAQDVAVRVEEQIPALGGWFEARAYPSRQGLSVHLRDVTAQHQDHEALFVSEERFRLLAKATNDAIWDLDVGTGQLRWNDGFATLFGHRRSEEESTLASWTTRIHPEERARVVAGFRAAIANGGDKWSDEYRFRREDGDYAYVLDRGHIIRNQDGTPLRMIGGMTDLTARKQAEQRIAEQAALLDQARDAIQVRDLAHAITYWNKGAERLFGWSAAEAVGRSAPELLAHEGADFDQAMAVVLATGEWSGELSPVARDGRQLLIEARWTLVRDEADAPRAILVISTDITERRKLEQQFLRAQRLESLGTLAGGIAHDLNNVLTPIMLSIGMLAMNEKDPHRLRTIASMEASTKRGADMVRQVLTFARGVEGRRLPVPISRLLREVAKIANDTFLKNIVVRVETRPGLLTVLGDSTQLHQVLLNLCVNARDAMPSGGTLTLAAENLPGHGGGVGPGGPTGPGPQVGIRIADTGTGVPSALLDKIFEPFFTTKEVGKGTGLGLSTSIAVVKSHGGSMRVSSALGQGTTFWITLPALATAESPAASDAEEALPRGHDELVLVVDDEPAVRHVTKQILEASGYRVLLAANGEEAIALFSAQPDDIALVLTDMMMPIMDGDATIRALEEIRPGVRIIATSGLSARPATGRPASAHVQHFLTKPYAADTLLNRLQEALGAD